MRFFAALVTIAAAPLLAQTHDFYRSDFTVLPCTPANACQSMPDSQLTSSAYKLYALTLDMKWVEAHRDAVVKALETACRRHASCLAVPGNTYYFCDDLLSNEARPVCDKLFPGDEQCRIFLETWLLGIDMRWKYWWPAAQECAKKTAVAHTKPLEIWMSPEKLPAGFQGKIAFYSLDPDTHLPVFATFAFDNETALYASANPAGLPATGYPFDYRVKLKRVPNPQGHTDVVGPSVTASAEGYRDVTFQLAAEVPKMVVTMTPPADKLRAGKNVVTVEAHDAKTGKPVEARVMFGDDVAGDTNKPITLHVPRRKRPQIWVTSLFNTYSDTVVAPAE